VGPHFRAYGLLFGEDEMGIVIGITGGIAAGKSTVARMFVDMGAGYLDADAIARGALSQGTPAEEAVIDAFGMGIIDVGGNIDRGKLGDIVFSDDSARKKLNEITHPAIIKTLEERIAEFRETSGPRDVLVAEIPLLIEANLTAIVDKVILVVAEQPAQQNRLRMRGSLSQKQIDQRIESQMPACQKIEFADWVIDADGALQDTESQVRRIWDHLQTCSNVQ
jgi:dephospho-CoA kinase